MAWRQGRALNGNVVVFYGVEIFMLFSSIWDVCCCWMHDECVARELPSEMQLVEISWWNGRRMNSKVDK
jgi:hypothetical protein